MLAAVGYRRHYLYLSPFGDLRAHIVAAPGVERLIDFRAVAKASSAGTPIIGRTVLADSGTGLRAELEYPIKTINIRYRPDVYQFDTGPVLFPDLGVRREVWADYLSLAFLAYETRTDGYADFVIESAVPVGPRTRRAAGHALRPARASPGNQHDLAGRGLGIRRALKPPATDGALRPSV